MPKSETSKSTKTASPKLPSEIFSVDFNESLVHQVLTSYMSSERQGSVLLKNRSDVRGGGKKPFRQKRDWSSKSWNYKKSYLGRRWSYFCKCKEL